MYTANSKTHPHLSPQWPCYRKWRVQYSTSPVDGTAGPAMVLCSSGWWSLLDTAKYHVGCYENHDQSTSRNHFAMAGHSSNL